MKVNDLPEVTLLVVSHQVYVHDALRTEGKGSYQEKARKS